MAKSSGFGFGALCLVSTLLIVVTYLLLSRSSDEVRWKDLQAKLDLRPQEIVDKSSLAALQYFVRAPPYRAQATTLAKRVLGDVADRSAFVDLTRLLFPEPDKADLSDLVSISYDLALTKLSLERTCRKFDVDAKLVSVGLARGVCDPNWKPAIDDQSRPMRKTRREYFAVLTESVDLSNLIAQAFRAERARSPDKPLSLQRSLLDYVSFRSVDFSHTDVSNAALDIIDLTDAVLTPERFTDVALPGSNWWDAKVIDQDLLDHALEKYYPGSIPEEPVLNAHGRLTRAAYAERVGVLCQPFRPACADANLKFDAANIIETAAP